MHRIFYLVTLIFVVNLNVFAQDYEPVLTEKVPVIDTFYNHYTLTDNYRWLENIRDNKTIDWIEQQNKLSQKFLSKARQKTNSFTLIDKYTYTEYDNPKKEGKYYFTYAYYNTMGVPGLFYQEYLKDDPEIIVDPSSVSNKDNILIRGFSVSKNSKLLAYQYTRNGSDWAELKIKNLEDKTDKKDYLTGLKFSAIEWMGDGFFYSTFYQDGEFGETLWQQVYYHKVGTDQGIDNLIFERKGNPYITFDFITTSDERFFILQEKDEHLGRISYFYIDYNEEKPHIKPLLINFKQIISFIDSYNGKLIASTFYKANNGRVIEIDPSNPLKWREIAPEFSESLLLKTVPFSDRIVTVYQTNQHPIIVVYDYSGKILYKLELPVATSVDGFSGNFYDEELLFSFKSYTVPPVVYKFNIKTFNRELTKKTTVTFDYQNIEYKELDYPSSDSITVPMILVYQKGLELNGGNPTILKAYGGFGVVAQPSFDPGIVHFIKSGGVFAFANIRGGADKGAKWAFAGRGDEKQNSFDDFIAAAEYLIKEKYTNPKKLAITGGSNGGLVIAASAIQRPDLFKVVVPVVAPLDMLRFEKFTVGAFHKDEYGTINDSTSFVNLLQYSPYQNIEQDVNYPTMLIVTSENDDRVPPFHSYKFVAAMQNRDAQKNPILLKVEENTGHYGANTLKSIVKEDADIYGFILYQLAE